MPFLFIDNFSLGCHGWALTVDSSTFTRRSSFFTFFSMMVMYTWVSVWYQSCLNFQQKEANKILPCKIMDGLHSKRKVLNDRKIKLLSNWLRCHCVQSHPKFSRLLHVVTWCPRGVHTTKRQLQAYLVLEGTGIFGTSFFVASAVSLEFCNRNCFRF